MRPNTMKSGFKIAPISFVLFVFSVLLSLLSREALAESCDARSITVTRVSSPVFYFDPGLSPKLSSGYVGYKVTNNSNQAISDLWVKLEQFTGGVISLAPNENGVSHVGRLASRSSAFVYFYLSATRQTTVPQRHDVTVYSANPDLNQATCEEPFSYLTYDTIAARANKVTSIEVSPSEPEFGGLLTITVRGNTGTVGSAGNFAFTPAVLSGWPANAFELEDVEITLRGGENRTVRDTLFLSRIASSSSEYVQTYRFRVKGNPSTSTSIYPANYISSGNEMKHTDTSGFGSFPPIVSPVNKVLISGFASDPAGPACVSGGSTVQLSLTITNGGSVPARLDDIQVTLPTWPAQPSYVTGSSTFRGESTVDPVLMGWQLLWSNIFEVPAGEAAEFTFEVTIPGASGSYDFSAVGHIDDLQIDSTLTQVESAPATESVCVGTPPTATPTPTITPTLASDGDTDNDGIPDSTEGTSDPDGDSIPNNEDRDSDGDGTPDIIEAGGEDDDKDGQGDSTNDSDGDGITDPFDPDDGGSPLPVPDSDGDGVPDFRDRDSDDDGIPDSRENGGQDTDGDGRIDPEGDSDSDGFDDSVDPDTGGDPLPNPDTDGDGDPDATDGDSDGDGIHDRIEDSTDDNFDPPSGNDTDNDGTDNSYDPDSGGDTTPPTDTDSDGLPDYRDTDSDGDGTPDQTEAFDTNDDGVPDVSPSGLDTDQDGIDDSFEPFDSPDDISDDVRREEWRAVCAQRNIASKVRRTRKWVGALHKRVASFASKSRACRGGALSAEVAKAAETFYSISERVSLEFGGELYRCPSTVCFASSTSRGKRSLQRLVDSLTAQAKTVKRRAIASCNTPPRDPSIPDNRRNTDDYRNEVVSSLKVLPARVTRCP